MTDASPTAESPQLGPYHIETLVGEGAYARVYRAVDERLNRTVALKILKPTLLGDPDAVRRFLREAQVAAGLFHQRLATVLDAGEAGGYYYLAMRYVEGPNLAQVLAERGPLPWDEVVRLTQQIAEALSVLHAQGIVHRDLKPQNILLEHGREVVLTDFGLIHALHNSGLSTHSTALVGTPAYIPPESWEGQKATPQADQYALACVVYEMATGKVLYDGPSTPAIMRKHFGEPPLPEVWPEGVPAGLGAVLRKALAQDPEARYEDIRAFAAALARLGAATQSQKIGKEPVDRSVRTTAVSRTISTSTSPPVTEEPKSPLIPGQRQSAWMRAGLAVAGLAMVFLFGLLLSRPWREQNPGRDQLPTSTLAATSVGVAAPEGSANSSSQNDCSRSDVFCVGLVTDLGTIDDRSFNQSAWEGVKMAQEKGIADQIDYIETKDANDYEANIELFARNGYDVIVTVGFALGEATETMADRYPNLMFIGVDQFQFDSKANVAGLIFHEDQAGFLAGALAGMMTKTNKVAAVLGTNLVPPVVAYGTGYENGAKYVNHNVEVITTYHPGDLTVAFTDPEWGAYTAKQAIDRGADVIFGAAGRTGNGAIIEAAQHPGVYCVGIDIDQWYTVPEARSCLVSSAIKLVASGVFDLIQKANSGNFPSGNYYGEVGLAPFHDFDSHIPQSVKDKLTEIREGLADGSISTGYP